MKGGSNKIQKVLLNIIFLVYRAWQNEVCMDASQNIHMEILTITTNSLINILIKRASRKAGGS